LLTRNLIQEANQANIEAVSKIGSRLRHAEVIEAMGMLPALARRWRPMQVPPLAVRDLGGTRARALSSIGRTARVLIQIGSLGIGTLLAMQQEISPGAMIAPSLIIARFLMPFEGIVENWREWGRA
ncbi:type I secretion system permease/ATPase, partial [Brucella oryzae]